MADKNDLPVGAKAKIQNARRQKALGAFGINPNARVRSSSERLVVTILIAALACVLAYFLTEGPFKAGQSLATGNDFFDNLLFSATPISFTGNPTTDYAIAIAARGLLLLIAAGFAPLVSWVWYELLDKPEMSPYRVMWAVTLVLGLGALLLWPVLVTIFSNFAQLFG